MPSRRLRFEILRRDRFACKYCGRSAPDVALTVDHVIPITLGGGDEPRNLVTACVECNAGKSSVAPDSPIVDDVDATALLFAGALDRVSKQRRADRALMESIVDEFDRHWCQWQNADGGVVMRNVAWRESIEQFIGLGLDLDELRRFATVAMEAHSRPPAWKYFCGCCWREVSTRQELARRLIEGGEI